MTRAMKWKPLDADAYGQHFLIYRTGWIRARIGNYSSGSWWTNGERLIGEPDFYADLPEPPEAKSEELK